MNVFLNSPVLLATTILEDVGVPLIAEDEPKVKLFVPRTNKPFVNTKSPLAEAAVDKVTFPVVFKVNFS